MPAASIKVNGVGGHPPPGADDVPINALVQFDNQAVGDETTYQWVLHDQPPGALDALVNPTTKIPMLTPKKEGSYLVELIVDLGLPTECRDTAVVAVRQLKTRFRVPAAGEEDETNLTKGWGLSANEVLRRVDALSGDSGVHVVVVGGAVPIAAGKVVRCTGAATLKAGLPGQEVVPSVESAPATLASDLWQPLGVLIGDLAGASPVASGRLAVVRQFGLLPSCMAGGAPAVGDPVYVNDTSDLSLTPGTNGRVMGLVAATSAGVHSVFLASGASTIVSVPTAIREASGPTDLAVGVVGDAQALIRNGSTLRGKYRLGVNSTSDISTTLSTWFTRATRTTAASMPAGYYCLSGAFTWYSDQGGRESEFQWLLDLATQLYYIKQRPSVGSITQRHAAAFFAWVNLAAGAHQFDFEMKGENAGDVTGVVALRACLEFVGPTMSAEA